MGDSPFPLIVGRPTDEDVVQAPVEAAQSDYAKMSPGVGGFISAFNRAENPVGSTLLPLAEQSQFREHSWWRDYINANVAMYGGTDQVEYQPSPKLNAEAANKQYPNPDPNGKPLFAEPIEQKLAETIAKQKGEQFQAQTDMARFEMNHGPLVNFPTAMAATFTDPLNIATAFIPGFGEEALAAKLGVGLFGRIATRAAIGAEAGAIQQGVGSALKLGAADDLRTDYSIRDALKETLLGAAGGAILNVGAGGLVDTGKYLAGRLTGQEAARARARLEAPAIATADAETNHAAAQSAVSQIVTGRPVDVADFFPQPPERPTETALGQILNNPFFERVEPAELGLDRREVAKSIAPNMLRELEAAEQQRTGLASQLQEMNAARTRGETQANQLIADQIEQTQQQLAGKLSKANRETAEQRLAELQGQIERVPSEQDFAAVQQQFQDADNALRDVTARTAPIFQRADETIARATAAETGQRFEDLIQRQNQFMTRDFSGLVDREMGWRKTGVAPGITHDDLVRATNEVEQAAKNAPIAPVPQDKPPENWMQQAQALRATANAPGEATGAGEAAGAPTAPPAEKAPVAAPERPARFEEVYPELADRNLAPEEKSDLMAAHKEVEAADLKEGAYQEAASCLKAG